MNWAEDEQAINQIAYTLDVSRRGARLAGITGLKGPGQLIVVRRNMGEARFRVVWIGRPRSPQEGQVGIECVEPDKTELCGPDHLCLFYSSREEAGCRKVSRVRNQTERSDSPDWPFGALSISPKSRRTRNDCGGFSLLIHELWKATVFIRTPRTGQFRGLQRERRKAGEHVRAGSSWL